MIGGPPCQIFSKAIHLAHAQGHGVRFGNLIPEFQRVIEEALPVWFLMENVPAAAEPSPRDYIIQTFVLNNRWLGEKQDRLRKFWFGNKDGITIHPEVALFEPLEKVSTVLASSGGKQRASMSRNLPIKEMCLLQGLPEDFLRASPFTKQGLRELIGNGVPLVMGKAIAKAIRKVMYSDGSIL